MQHALDDADECALLLRNDTEHVLCGVEQAAEVFIMLVGQNLRGCHQRGGVARRHGTEHGGRRLTVCAACGIPAISELVANLTVDKQKSCLDRCRHEFKSQVSAIEQNCIALVPRD
jgi:hypothetical protein